jgi:methionyl-tRNA formyltransferase
VRIVFWGTPEFATPALRALVGEGHDVVAVVTQPDRPRERGGRNRSRLDPSPVKQVALDEGIPVLQPDRPRGPEFVGQLRALQPDVSVVVAYGHILPQDVIELPRLGTLNIHGSLLPKYRGAAPIQAAIRDGCTATGVTIMQMVPALDAGPVILATTTDILPDETAGELQLRLAELGAEAIVEALALLEVGGAVATPQDDAMATYAPKVGRDDARVEWSTPAAQVERVIRAYDPRPGAWTTLRGVELRLFGARPAPSAHGAPGTILAAEDGGIVVACGSAAVRIADVHPAGRKRLRAAEWLRGRGAAIGDVLGASRTA